MSIGSMKRRTLSRWTPESRRGLVIAGLLALALLAGAVFLVWALGGFQQLKALTEGLQTLAERLRAFVEGTGAWAPLAYVAVKALTFAVAPFLSSPLNVASGALFGIFWGVMLTAVGDTLAGCALYGLSRLLGRGAVARLAGERGAKRVDRVLDRGLGGWRELLFFRLVLPVPYNLVSLAAGLSRGLPFRQYLVVTFLTASIPNVFEVGLGAGLVVGQWTQAAVSFGLAAVAVAALLTHRQIRDALVRALRSKLGARDRPRGQDGHEKDEGQDRRADTRSGEADKS